jgi:hypothetical protein
MQTNPHPHPVGLSEQIVLVGIVDTVEFNEDAKKYFLMPLLIITCSG